VYVSGRVSQLRGEVGSEVAVADATRAARDAMIDLLAIVKQDIGDLDRIVSIEQVRGFVRSAPTIHGAAARDRRRVGPADRPVRRERTPRPNGDGSGTTTKRRGDPARHDRTTRTPRHLTAQGDWRMPYCACPYRALPYRALHQPRTAPTAHCTLRTAPTAHYTSHYNDARHLRGTNGAEASGAQTRMTLDA
jgi:hypothetical protein